MADRYAEPEVNGQERVEATTTDGRVARRQRNIDNVIAVVIEMFGEESMFPTIEQVATRSGLSLRSLYRYFADPGELLEATIVRHRRMAENLAHLPAIGRGPRRNRIDDFVTMRLRLYAEVAPAYRATVVNAAHHPRIRDALSLARNDFRAQFERQFEPELGRLKGAERNATLSAGDLLTQLDSIDFLRRHRQMSVAETDNAIRFGLSALL